MLYFVISSESNFVFFSEIDRRLQQLDINSHVPQTELSNLQNLRDQEARNQQALEMLKSQVKDLGAGRSENNYQLMH